MPPIELDTLMRLAAFKHTRRLTESHDALKVTELKPGFLLRDERLPLVCPRAP